MSGNLLSIGKSGLFAAQAGLSTTGHNIANANVAGYNRQTVVQSTAPMMETGVGFIGTGTQIDQIKRYSDEFLNTQVRNAQASKSGLDSYYSQISQIDNMLADQTAGLSPSLQSFFKGVQDMAANRGSVPSRQSMLSSADTLATRFQALDSRLGEIREGINSTIESSITTINSYASQIADLNEKIGTFASAMQRAPNDLLDKRDQLVMELNTQVKATVRPGDNGSLTVSIGSGQPLVVGQRAFELAATKSPTDLTRLEVGYVTGSKVSVLGENALSGGTLGGALEFRSKTLDPAQSALGKVAIGLAFEFNQQHKLGLDQNGAPGGDFFSLAPAYVGKNINNASTSTTKVEAVVSNPAALADSDFKVEFDGTDYQVIRLSDNQKTAYTGAGAAQTIYGVDFKITGTAAKEDNFLVRPTIGGAANFNVLVKDVAGIAAAAPIATSAPVGNTGTAKISEGKVDANFLGGAPALPVTLSFDKASGNLTGFPAGTVRVVDSTGAASTVPSGSVQFKAGSTYTFGGISVTMSGAPGDGDTFKIASNGGGIGDTRNIGLLGDLQTKNIFNNGTATLQSSYAQLVSTVGNKTREVQVNGQAGEALLTQAQAAAQDVSGVNLDEEATNLIKYQQAYQAAGKVMQIAGSIFDTLLSIGR
ncbi:flagellar hook-associated protein FlgK [Telluria aromaticivorans]|uniref:Flagellar hook-associated protein 1 n=1 Tax=Telluria aromaticivorans TaxID=2725995 RepID=A0A7Y2JYB8_9BURK|nr:flagellar hook-associated protein FlgK [Telluria aromaticivorans]NNG22638.1 flagellar hook-associated protein FlgK [Telluria aromaticivorans]